MIDNNNTYNKITSIVMYASNIIFFIIHIFYMILFLISKSYFLAYFNLCSAILYLLLFIIINKKYTFTYALICGAEIPFYMTMCTMLCGFDSGFHLCLIGLCVLAFVAAYFLKDKKHVINPIYVSVGFMMLFLISYFYLKYNNPLYNLPDYLNTLLFITHTIIVFIFVIGFLYAFVKYIFLLEKRIRRESETDRLTQIANRNSLIEYFNKLGNQKKNYVVAIFDVDDFKKFNDINAHLCGDYVLMQIASIAKNNSYNDFVSRWGGEEFVIISKIEDDLDKTYSKIDNIRKSIAAFEFNYNNKKLHSTITIGVAMYENDLSLDEWIKKADVKLYQGKNNGKNQIVY